MKKRIFKKTISVILACATLVSAIQFVSVSAENVAEKYPYVVFTGGEGNSLNFCNSNVTVNGSIHTNGSLISNGSNTNINGECGAVGGITKGHGFFNIKKVINSPAEETTISINQKVKRAYFESNCSVFETQYTENDININVNKSLYSNESINLFGNIALNGPLGAKGSITLSGNALNSNNTVLYSENGDINIKSNSATINGLIYAPNGIVNVSGKNFQVNGIIIAKELVIDSDNVNINYSDSVAGFVGTNSEAPSDLIDIGKAYFKNFNNSDIQNDDSGIFFVKNQILLTASSQLSYNDVNNIVSRYDAKIVGYIQLSNDYQIQFNNETPLVQLNQIMSELRQNASIENTSLNTIIYSEESFIPDDSEWKNEVWDEDNTDGSNWGVEAIHAPEAWNYKDQMQTVKVGLIDSMFDTTNQDIRFTQVWNNPDNISNSHGTSVAGIMAADFNNNYGIAGVTVNKKLYGYSIYGNTDANTSKIKYSAMEYKYAFALLIGNNVKVINFSLAYASNICAAATFGDQNAINYITTNSDIIGKYLEKLIAIGYDFVISEAAGNDYNCECVKDSNEYFGYRLYDSYKDDGKEVLHSKTDAKYNILSSIEIPGVKSRIICVGAISHERDSVGTYYRFADFSTGGSRVDVVSPGVSILAPGMNNTYTLESGTSLAAPYVAGIAGLLYSVNPALDGDEVKDIIIETSKSHTVSGHGEDDAYGVANAGDAVKYAVSHEGFDDHAAQPRGTVMGIVTDVNGNPLKDVQVNAYKANSSAGNIGGFCSSDETNDNGEFDLTLPEGQYYINICKDGYMPLSVYQYVKPEEVIYLEKSLLVSSSSADQVFTVSGKVTDAITGNAISNASIKFRRGWNNTFTDYEATSGSVISSITDSSGNYKSNLSAGNYTAEISKNGYITGYVNIISAPANTQNQNAVLTPVLSNDEYRIVLTWGDTPGDLDSHITGPSGGTSRFHVYFKSKNADNDLASTSLDIDDRSSFGPETITLKMKASSDGVFRYSVHDYTNKSSKSSSDLSLSGAYVKVYEGNSLIRTYAVPINAPGTLWNVFEIKDGEIDTINEMSFVSDPSSIA